MNNTREDMLKEKQKVTARRAWARNLNSTETSIEFNKMRKESDHITSLYLEDEKLISDLVDNSMK